MVIGWFSPEFSERAFLCCDAGISRTTAVCTVVTAHTRVTCQTVAGVGKDLSFQIVVGTLQSNSFATSINYQPPAVTGVAYPSGGIATAGGDTVVISECRETSPAALFLKLCLPACAAGSSFGPVGTPSNLIAATFGPAGTEFACPVCTVNSQNQISCTVPVNLGKNHAWILAVAAQAAAITTPSAAHTSKLPTAGAVAASVPITTHASVSITITGTNVSPFAA